MTEFAIGLLVTHDNGLWSAIIEVIFPDGQKERFVSPPCNNEEHARAVGQERMDAIMVKMSKLPQFGIRKVIHGTEADA